MKPRQRSQPFSTSWRWILPVECWPYSSAVPAERPGVAAPAGFPERCSGKGAQRSERTLSSLSSRLCCLSVRVLMVTVVKIRGQPMAWRTP